MRCVPLGARSAAIVRACCGWGHRAGQLGAQPTEDRRGGPVLPLRGQECSGAALVDVADALERLRSGAEPEQGPEAPLVGGVLEGLVPGEHAGQVGAVHEGREHEVDEAALVALAAPVVQAPRRVLVEGAVAAAKDPVVPGEVGEPLGHPQLGARPKVGEHGEAGAQRGEDEVSEAALEVFTLGPLVVHGVAVVDDGGHGRRPLVGEDHGVPAFEDRGNGRGRGDHGGDGHVSVEEAELVRTAHEGIDLAGDAGDRQAGHGRRVLNGGEAVTGRRDDAQCRARVVRRERLHRHDGVDAPAEGDERPARVGVVGHGRSGYGLGPRHAESAQVEAVAVGELARGRWRSSR